MAECRSAFLKRALTVAFSLALLAFIDGCTTDAKKRNAAGQGSGPVDGLVLLSAAAAVDTHPPAGPDAVEMVIYPTGHDKPKTLPISSGKLEVLMFDGVINDQTSASVQPLKVWTLQPAELKASANKTAIGTSYPLTLLWGNNIPKQDNITIIARYVDPSGRTVYSAPSTIPVGARRGR